MNTMMYKKSYKFPYIYKKVTELIIANSNIPFYNDYDMILSEVYKQDISYLCRELKQTDFLTQNTYTILAKEICGLDVYFGLLDNKNVICIKFLPGTYNDDCNYKIHEITFNNRLNMIISMDYTRYRNCPQIIEHNTGHLIL